MNSNSKVQSRTSQRGFTLVELMVATTIFAITMSSLFFTFRTANMAYETAVTHGERQLLGRYAVNQLTDDIRNIFYKPENAYNVTRRQREALLEQQLQQALQSGSQMPEDDEMMVDLGPAIDLSFTAEDSGEQDMLTLVRAHPNGTSADRPMWGLSRVTYYIVDDALYRAVDDITKPEVDVDGYEIPKPIPPRVDKIANWCTGFDMKFGYFYDGEWLLADSWDSKAAMFRNPSDEEEDEDIIDPTRQENGAQQGGIAGLAAQGQQQDQKADDLPGWIELTFKFADGPPAESGALGTTKEPNVRTYKQTIFVLNKFAMETYVPEQDEGLEQTTRANERSGGRGGSNQRGREGRGEGRSNRGSNTRGTSS